MEATKKTTKIPNGNDESFTIKDIRETLQASRCFQVARLNP